MDAVTKLHKGGADLELLIFFMREKGFHQIDTIIALRRVLDISLNDAKCMVDESAAWSDQYEKTQAVRQAALKALMELNKENDSGLPSISINPCEE